MADLDADQLRAAAPRTGRIAVAAAAGCHRAGQLIMMADGGQWPVEEVVVGDQVMGPDFKPRNVLELCRGRQQMVRIVPVTGEPWFVNFDHVLTLEDTTDNLHRRTHSATLTWAERAIDVTVHELLTRHVHLLPALRLIRARPLNGAPEYVPFTIDQEGTKDEKEDYFGFRLDGDQRYLLADSTVTHNSGKTTLLVGRALELAMEGVHPAGIVTLAFNKNAKETLQERLSAHQVTAPHANRMAFTFHGFAFDVIRRLRPELRALTSNAEEDARAESRGRQEQHLKTAYDVGNDVWNALGCRSKDKDTRPTWCDAVSLTELMSIESGARERLYDVWPKIAAPENKEALLLKLRSLELSEVTEPMLQALAAFMGPFLRARKHERGIDFSDMLLLLDFYVHATASTHEQTRAFHQTVRARLASIEHLQVDESQDGNELRWRLAKAVAAMPTNKSVMAVGDLRQSITGFAGAQPQLFKDWYDGATHRFDLPRNYRSASKIVRAGNLVAAGEDWNVGGDSIAARKDLGAGDVTVGAIGPLSIGLQIAEGIDNGRFTPQQVTVLARTKAVLEVVAFAIRARGIRVQVRGGGNAWGGVDGKLVLAYLAFSEGLAYDVTAFHRAINSPYRYVSAKKAREWLFGEPAPVSPAKLALQTLRRDADNEYPPAVAVLEAYLELRSSSWERRCELIENWLMEKLQAEADENPSAPGPKSDKAEFQRSLCSIAKSAQSLESLLIVIAAEADEKKPTEEEKAKTVTLSTIHRAKGDQWHTVYLTGVREGIFPHALSVSEEELAEELRLLYVAVTRPVKELIIDVTPERGSRFQHKLDALRTLNEGAYEGPEEGPPDDDDDGPGGGGGSGGGSGGSDEDEGAEGDGDDDDLDAGEDAERQATDDGGRNPGRDGEASSAGPAPSTSSARARARDESIQRAVNEALRAAAAVTASGRAAAGSSPPPGAPCVPCAPVQPCAPGSTSTSRAAGAQYAPTPGLPLPAPGTTPHPGPVAPVAPHLTEAPPPTKRTQTGIVKALKADLKRARRLGNENPPDTSGTRPGDSSTRYVPVSIEAMRELLGPHEFIEDPQLEPRARQKVLSLTFVDGERLAVYTSIPRSSEDARDAGEDSIKVMRLSREGRPLAKAQPRTYRTQNWRENLLKRLLALVGVE